MESSKNISNNTLKGHSTIGSNNNNRFKYTWSYGSSSSSSSILSEDHYLGGFSWPPRSYTCTFCKREFRSAQALGGHMNVHRRDRARLRVQQLSPPPKDTTTTLSHHNHLLNLNLNPNPNPIITSFSPTNFTPYTTHHPLPLSALSSTTTTTTTHFAASSSSKKTTRKYLFDASEDHEDEDEFEDGHKFLKKAENIVRLDLEIGLSNNHNNHTNEDLDLELRLGYS